MTRPMIRGTRIPRRRSSAPDGCAGLCRSATLRRAAQTTGRLSRRAGAARRAMRCVPCWPVNTQTLCRAARLLGARLGVPTGGTSTTCKYGNSHSPADRSHEPGDDTAASVTHPEERKFAQVARLTGSGAVTEIRGLASSPRQRKIPVRTHVRRPTGPPLLYFADSYERPGLVPMWERTSPAAGLGSPERMAVRWSRARRARRLGSRIPGPPSSAPCGSSVAAGSARGRTRPTSSCRTRDDRGVNAMSISTIRRASRESAAWPPGRRTLR